MSVIEFELDPAAAEMTDRTDRLEEVAAELRRLRRDVRAARRLPVPTLTQRLVAIEALARGEHPRPLLRAVV